MLKVLAGAIEGEKEIKGIQIVKEEVKLLLFASIMMLYIRNPLNFTRKLLDIVGGGALVHPGHPESK